MPAHETPRRPIIEDSMDQKRQTPAHTAHAAWQAFDREAQGPEKA
jgi:hypothetical protein